MAFLENAFRAEERGRLCRPDGTIMHVEVEVQGSVVMLGAPMGEFGPGRDRPTLIERIVEDER